MKTLLFLRSLNVGGAERQASQLAKGLRRRGHEVAVMLLYPGGAFADDLAGAGIPIHSLDKKGRWDNAAVLVRLVSFVRSFAPDVLYSFLPVPNLITAVARPFLPSPTRLVWGIRCSNMDLSHYDRLARLSYGLSARLSTAADLVIANSEDGARQSCRLGYAPGRTIVIRNGIDLERFRPDPVARRQTREKLGLVGDDVAIGLVARLDPIKGHHTFITAARLAADRDPRLKFVLVGGGTDDPGGPLAPLLIDAGLGERLLALGERHDIPAITNALDIVVSASYSEGFSNTLSEGIACGKICVATDVGDSAIILAGTGKTIPPGNASAMAEAFVALASLSADERASMGAAAFRHGAENFGEDRMVINTEAAMIDLLARGRGIPATKH